MAERTWGSRIRAEMEINGEESEIDHFDVSLYLRIKEEQFTLVYTNNIYECTHQELHVGMCDALVFKPNCFSAGVHRLKYSQAG